MSQSELKRFNQELLNNPELLEHVRRFGSNMEAIVEFANKKGFIFSVEELKEKEGQNRELDIETLEQVSGGTRVVFLITTVTAVGVVALINEN